MELTLRSHARDRHETVFDADAHVAGVARCGGPPDSTDQETRGPGACEAHGNIRRDVRAYRSPLDPTRTAAEGHPFDGSALRKERASVLRAARLQPHVPVVSR